jgi:hypothetical protein
MVAAPAAPPPRSARRVVLTAVARRDAAQRLSLALCLVARAERTRQERASLVGGSPRPGPRPAPSSKDMP